MRRAHETGRMCQHREAVPRFGKRAAPLGEEERQAAAVDLERIARGGIPLGAEQRLKRIAAGESAVFSSDLSAKEYAVAHASGLTPIAQIMGSSVVQNGWQNYGWSSQPGRIAEVPSFAEPWNLSRQRAFDRLRQEAQFAGADAVIGIEMTARAFPGSRATSNIVVFGTAVRENTPGPRSWFGPANVRAVGPGCRQAASDRRRDRGRHRSHLRGRRGAQRVGQSDDGDLVGQPGDD